MYGIIYTIYIYMYEHTYTHMDKEDRKTSGTDYVTTIT